MRIRRTLALSLVIAVSLGEDRLLAQVTFVDEAAGHEYADETYGRGSAMADLDGDGLLDIITGNDGNPNDFFRQLPDHTFEKANDLWGIAFDERSTWATLVADFDNDGDPDVYFINGSFPGQPNQLLRNDLSSSGVFTDVSDEAGDGAISIRNFGGTALDYNRDGLLDIFLTSPNNEPCFLLRNDGELQFTDVSTAAGIIHAGAFRHCSAGDYNNDGWDDIAVGNYTGANVLYKNNQDGTFTNALGLGGPSSPNDNFGLVLEDFDNDGCLDLFIPKYYYQDDPPGTSEIYRNNCDGTFTDVTLGSGMTAQTDMGHNTGDVDGDGYPDIYIGTGHPGFKSDDLLLLVTPNGPGGFVVNDVSDSSGITANGPTRCHGIVLGDYDQDGYVDIYINNGGPPSSEDMLEENFLWHNQGNANAWTALRLTGVVSNRTAVGARCVATTDSGREVHRMLRVGSGFGNTNSPIVHFGIGSDQSIEQIEITWPSGILQTIVNPPMSQIIDVTETVSEPCEGDANGDGVVDPLDAGFVLARFGCPVGTGDPNCDTADMNGDGLVDPLDVGFVLARFGKCR
ncbi:MAG: VCBS repeat-containing protein [Planctomycetes bacterium]|nr:VCBS repeat-containing protein [Planctomycetota bacterium]